MTRTLSVLRTEGGCPRTTNLWRLTIWSSPLSVLGRSTSYYLTTSAVQTKPGCMDANIVGNQSLGITWKQGVPQIQ